jgi:TRAP-type C4-dicarboxylate transport system permease small subunit
MRRTQLRQSVGVVNLFASLGLAAVMIWITWKLSAPAMTVMDSEATTQEVVRSVQWTDTLLTNLPIVFVLMAVVGGIAFVVFQTRFV